MVVSIVALVVALGGTATAATLVVSNSAQIKNGAVKSADLADGKGVNVVDLTRKARRSLRGARGPQGAQGAQGAQGVQGVPGTPGGLNSVVTRFTQDTLEDGTASSITATCNPGEKLIGGGARMGNTSIDTSDLRLTSSRPTSDAGAGFPEQGGPIAGWRVVTWNVIAGPNADITVFAYALCAQ